MQIDEVLRILRKNSNPNDRAGMARFGINPKFALGVRVPVLRTLARKLGKNHTLAQQLWQTKIHEARILASMVDEPKLVPRSQVEAWVKEFNSWDLCDQCCMNLFDKLSYAWTLPRVWMQKEPEYVRRAGFALIACLAWHDKKTSDHKFFQFFPLIKKYATDKRNFVKKSVNWALRQIGKRSPRLRRGALIWAKKIQKLNSRVARWIAADAIRELGR